MANEQTKRNIWWNSVGSFTYLLSQWIITLLVIRLSTNLNDAGYLNLAITVTALFGTAATCNLRTYIISDETGSSSQVYSGLRFFTCIFAFIACLVYSSLFDYTIPQLSCIAMYMVYRILDAVTDLLYAFEQKESRLDIGGKSMLLRGILSLAGFSITFWFTENVLWGIGAMTALSFLQLVLLDYAQAKPFGSFFPKMDIKTQAAILAAGGIITLASSLSDWIVTYSRQVVESTLGNEMLGIYATVAAPVLLVQVGASYIFNPFLPSLHGSFSNGDEMNYRNTVSRIIGMIGVLTIFALLAAKYLGYPVLSMLYGSVVASYYYLLPTLVLLTALNAIQWFIRILLVMQRHIYAQLSVSFLSCALALVITHHFLSEFGLMGANYSILICYAFGTLSSLVLLILFSAKHFKTRKA